jgi:hypothetical protein
VTARMTAVKKRIWEMPMPVMSVASKPFRPEQRVHQVREQKHDGDGRDDVVHRTPMRGLAG